MTRRNTPRLPDAGNVQQLFDGQTPAAVEAVFRACSLWMENAGRMQAEWARFVGERIAQDMELPGRLIAAKTPSELLERQMAFINAMAAEYAEEGRRMLDLANGGVRDMADAARTGEAA